MTDITAQILDQYHDPYYEPLAPSYDELTEYVEDLEYEGNQITLEWATREILTHRMGWVRVGLVADRVRRYRLYQGKFPDWKTWCKKVLGKENWQVNKTIAAASITMELIRENFAVVPTCQSHAEKLIDCCKKSKMLLSDAWSIITEQLPEQFLITSNRIGEILGFPAEKKRISLPSYLRDRLQDAAFNDGITVEQKIQQLLDMEEGVEPEPETEEELEEKEELWRKDMQKLIAEHDFEIWLLSAVTKLINQGKREISQFNYLRQFRYQI